VYVTIQPERDTLKYQITYRDHYGRKRQILGRVTGIEPYWCVWTDDSNVHHIPKADILDFTEVPELTLVDHV
jgi:hypothetical protein